MVGDGAKRSNYEWNFCRYFTDETIRIPCFSSGQGVSAMVTTVVKQREACGRFGRWPLFGAMVTAAVALGTFANPADAQKATNPSSQENASNAAERARCGGMDCEQLRAAGSKAKEIMASARECDASGGAYPKEFVKRVTAFYSIGVEEEFDPADPLVTRKFCREFVIGLLWDLFLEKVDSQPEPGDFQNPLDKESAARFRGVLTAKLPTAFDDLGYIQRTRIYRLAGKVLTPEDAGALSSLASELEPNDSERSLIDDAVARIMEAQ